MLYYSYLGYIGIDEGDERRDSFLDDVTSERSSNFGASPSLTAMDDERMDGDDRWKSRHALVEQKMNRKRQYFYLVFRVCFLRLFPSCCSD